MEDIRDWRGMAGQLVKAYLLRRRSARCSRHVVGLCDLFLLPTTTTNLAEHQTGLGSATCILHYIVFTQLTNETMGSGKEASSPCSPPEAITAVDTMMGPPPEAVVMDIVLGGWKSQALRAFVKSGLAEVLPPSGGDEFAKPSDLAKSVNPNLDANAVHRLLRFLSTIDVCIEHSSGGIYQLGPVGEVCKTSHPQSAADKVLLESSAAHTNMWTNLPMYLETGNKVCNDVYLLKRRVFSKDSFSGLFTSNGKQLLSSSLHSACTIWPH